MDLTLLTLNNLFYHGLDTTHVTRNNYYFIMDLTLLTVKKNTQKVCAAHTE